MDLQKSKLKFNILIGIFLFLVIASVVSHFLGFPKELYHLVIEMKNSPLFFLVYIGLFVVSSFLPIPFLTFFGAAVFPFHLVIIYSLIGNIILFTLMFYLTRWLGRDYVKYSEEKYKKLKNLDINFNKNSFRNLMLLRFFFLIPPEAVNILAGLSEMKFKDYILVSVIGSIPVLLASIMLVKGHYLHDSSLFYSALIILGLLVIIPLMFIPELRKMFNGKKKG